MIVTLIMKVWKTKKLFGFRFAIALRQRPSRQGILPRRSSVREGKKGRVGADVN